MDDKGSLWANIFFPVTDIRTDRRQWARDWDRGVIEVCMDRPDEGHAGAPAVFGMGFWKMDVASDRELGPREHARLRALQGECGARFAGVTGMLGREEDGRVWGRRCWCAWFGLVGHETRRDIVCDGFEEACRRSRFGQDARMLCPELGFYGMLWRRGEGLFDFVDGCVEMWDAGGMENFDRTMVRNEWWRKAYADKKAVPETPEIRRWCYEFMTCVRHLFMLDFITHTLKVLDKQCQSLPPDLPDDCLVAYRVLWNLGPAAAQELLDDKRDWNSRSMLACENCELLSDDLMTKFMACKVCKRKLNFEVRYCSKECQKADWPKHKENCGKNRVSKSVEGGHSEYSQSIALLLQIEIQDRGLSDYVLFSRGALPVPYGACFADVAKREMFFGTVEAILEDAGKPGLDVVAKCLVDAVDQEDGVRSGITREDVVLQLTEEHEVDVGSLLEQIEARLAVEGDEGRYRGMTIQEYVEHHDHSDSSSDSWITEES